MAEERKPIDISDIPELVRIVEAVQLTRQPQVLRRDREDVAVVVPVPAKGRRTRRKAPDHAAVRVWTRYFQSPTALYEVMPPA